MQMHMHMQMCWERKRVKKHSKQVYPSFTVSITKSPPGLPRNHPEVFVVTVTAALHNFVSLAEFAELLKLGDYSKKLL
jgi:hypothetical protein